MALSAAVWGGKPARPWQEVACAVRERIRKDCVFIGEHISLTGTSRGDGEELTTDFYVVYEGADNPGVGVFVCVSNLVNIAYYEFLKNHGCDIVEDVECLPRSLRRVYERVCEELDSVGYYVFHHTDPVLMTGIDGYTFPVWSETVGLSQVDACIGEVAFFDSEWQGAFHPSGLRF